MVGQNLVFPQILSSLSPVLPPSISSHCQDLSFITTVSQNMLANSTFIIYNKIQRKRCVQTSSQKELHHTRQLKLRIRHL